MLRKIHVLNAHKWVAYISKLIRNSNADWMLVKLINALEWGSKLHSIAIRYVNLQLTFAGQVVVRISVIIDRLICAEIRECKKRGAFRWYSLSISAVSNAQVLFALCASILSSAYCAPRAFHWFSNKALLFFNSVDRKQQERKLNHPVALSFCSSIVVE